MTKQSATARIIVEYRDANGEWKTRCFERSERMARRKIRSYADEGFEFRYRDNPHYDPSPGQKLEDEKRKQ